MSAFLQNFNFDQLSFWMGFLAGSLFWLLVRMLLPALEKMGKTLQAQAQSSRGDKMRAGEIRLSNDMLRLAQGWHLAANMFSLDEILVTPRLLAPPVPPEAEDAHAAADISDWAIPYMPDWPELGSLYGAPTFSLAEALQRKANITVIGEAGAGKSVALAHLAIQVIRHAQETAALGEIIPILLHAGDLVLPPATPENFLEPLKNALAPHLENKTNADLPKLLPSLFERKMALLLVDGLDEMPASQMAPVIEYLGKLKDTYPDVRMVTTAASNALDGLLGLDFFPLPVAFWSAEQRGDFLRRWGNLWERHIAKPDPNNPEAGKALVMMGGWLLNNTANLTPLELTLKVWAAYAGDSLGPQPRDAFEAHVRRLTHNQPVKNRQALEQLAAQMTLSMQPVTDLKNVENWIPGSGAAPDSETPPPEEEKSSAGQKGRVKVGGAIPSLIESGIVINRPGERVSLIHPQLAGYLAFQALGAMRAGDQIFAQPDWSGRTIVMRYLAVNDAQPAFLNNLLVDESTDPLLRGLFTTGRWLRDAPEKMPWISLVMRQLAACLQKENLPFGLKARALSALVLSGNSGIPVLLRQMLLSPRTDLRQLAALGMGFLREPKAVGDLVQLLEDKSPGVMQAAVLALVAIGDKPALEAVADALLQGDENLRRGAAEALANNVEEGHPTLEEASSLDDPLVRRAAVFGLARTRQPWAIKILEKLRSEEKQWVVQDVATQALSALERPNPRIPVPLPELTMTPWLIAFAGERGMGVAPGKPAYNLLYQALREGKEEQRLAALHYLSCKVDQDALLPVYQTYYASRGDLQETALNTIWHIAAAGITLPPPIQFGLK